MKQFSELFLALDQTNKTNEKVDLLSTYFISAPDRDKMWALALFSGRKPPRKIKSGLIQQWAMELAGIPEWLFKESYSTVGDLAETISLILPGKDSGSDKSLSDWFEYLLEINRTIDDNLKKQMIVDAWNQLSTYEVFVFNKLILGSFRIGVSQTLVVRAIAQAYGLEPGVIAHRVMGDWKPGEISFENLIHDENPRDERSRPYPFYLAYPIEGDAKQLGNPEDWAVEWKYDGIRSQIITRGGELFIWSRGEELMTHKFPELHHWAFRLKSGTVLDGEILCYADARPLPFSLMQTRIGRKNLSRKILEEAPVVFIGYDVLEFEGKDVRMLPFCTRRTILEKIQSEISDERFLLSPLVEFQEWKDLRSFHESSRQRAVEGFMLKRKSSTYEVGRKKGDWWKWKVEPLSIDAVLIYAQKGHGRRADLYTDYTFGVWSDGKLVTFAKAYSGLNDSEIREVDRFIRQNTLEKFGPVRTVAPKLVFEIGFEGINASGRHKSGIAVRFPRILRWRKDKPIEEADTLENLKSMLAQYGH